MKLASTLKASLLALGLVTLFSSCAEDNLSAIGESIQPGRDKVTGRATKLTFEATTVATPTLYTDGTTSLLGVLHDELDAQVTGEFVKQVRTAEGLTFEGAGNAQLTIDSVDFRIYSDRTEGDAAAQIMVNVYELKEPLTTAGTTSPSLAQYREGATLLGAATLQPKAGQQVAQNSPLRYFTIPLDVTLGKRIYEASISPKLKDAFSTQARFDKEILHGFYVSPVTGRGFLLDVTEVALMIHYSIPNPEKPAERIKYTKAFVDTKLTTRRNALSSGDVSKLTEPSAEYSYVKSPAGVTTEYTLSVAELQKLLKTVPAPGAHTPQDFIGKAWLMPTSPYRSRCRKDSALTSPTTCCSCPQTRCRSTSRPRCRPSSQVSPTSRRSTLPVIRLIASTISHASSPTTSPSTPPIRPLRAGRSPRRSSFVWCPSR